jgi:hypothetical protein
LAQVFAAYSCAQYWVLGLGAAACFAGAATAAGIEHGHTHLKRGHEKGE